MTKLTELLANKDESENDFVETEHITVSIFSDEGVWIENRHRGNVLIRIQIDLEELQELITMLKDFGV